MSEISLRILNMVRRSLIEEPEISDRTLYAAAAALDPSIGELTFQQFQARYPRRVRRSELGGKRSGRSSREAAAQLPLEERPYVYAPGSSTLEQPISSGEESEEPADADAKSRVRVVNGVRRVRTDGKPQGRVAEDASQQTSVDLLLGEASPSASPGEATGEREVAEPWPLRLHPEAERRVPPRAKRRTRRPVSDAQPTPVSSNGSKAGRTADGALAPGSAARQRLRDGVRSHLFQWARDLASAETRGDLIGVLARVDRYVDAITPLLADAGAIPSADTSATSATHAARPATAVPAVRPPVPAGKLIRSYKPSELDAMVRWVAGNRRTATDSEIVQAVAEELGFQRRGRRITTELMDSLRRVRGGS